MGIFGSLARGYVVDRLLHGQRRHGGHGRYGGGAGGYGHRGGPYGHRAGPHARRRGGRFGFSGPVPHYSRTTRGGTRVSGCGCCLPIPLLTVASGAAATVAATRRLRRA